MSHQDGSHLHENLQAIKGLFERMLPEPLASIRRHGNATLEPSWLAAVAISCWGWTPRGTLTDRVKTACSVVGRVWNVETTVSRQGLMKALASSGEALVELIVDQLAVTLSTLKGHWTRGGKVNIAVDGTKMKAPRTQANQRVFAASRSSRKRRTYRSAADASKAATVQVLMTVFWHLSTGLPLRWKIDGASGSERKSVEELIEQLPHNARLIGDAEYVGYPLWSTVINAGRSFLFRVGSNVTLLKNLGHYRAGDGYVYLWPDHALRKEQPPLVLRLFIIHNGRHRVYLVTNELAMPETLASELYRGRWGIEVFFRSIKQSCQRSKLCCGTPENVYSELHWTLLGIWSAMFLGSQTIAGEGLPPDRLSPVKVMRAFADTIYAIHVNGSAIELLSDLLTRAQLTDESRRTSSKTSRRYPRKKKRRKCGAPHLKQATTLQKQLARKLEA